MQRQRRDGLVEGGAGHGELVGDAPPIVVLLAGHAGHGPGQVDDGLPVCLGPAGRLGLQLRQSHGGHAVEEVFGVRVGGLQGVPPVTGGTG